AERRQQAQQRTEQRRLAGAVAAEHGERLRWRERARHVASDTPRAEAEREVADVEHRSRTSAHTLASRPGIPCTKVARNAAALCRIARAYSRYPPRSASRPAPFSPLLRVQRWLSAIRLGKLFPGRDTRTS